MALEAAPAIIARFGFTEALLCMSVLAFTATSVIVLIITHPPEKVEFLNLRIPGFKGLVLDHGVCLLQTLGSTASRLSSVAKSELLRT